MSYNREKGRLRLVTGPPEMTTILKTLVYVFGRFMWFKLCVLK